MLTLRIPKAEAVKPRQIRITPTVDGHSTNGSTNGSTAPADNGAGTRDQPTPKAPDPMASIRPERDPERPVYVISVAATLVSAHPRTLRIYEDEGLLCPARTPSNIRLYSENDIRRITWIRHLTRERGVNLAGIRILFELEERLGARILEALYAEGTERGGDRRPRPGSRRRPSTRLGDHRWPSDRQPRSTSSPHRPRASASFRSSPFGRRSSSPR